MVESGKFMGLLDIFRPSPDQQEFDSLKAEVRVLREQVYISSGYDPDINLDAFHGGSLFFSPLSKSNRELNPFTHERMLQLSFALYESNPIAKAVLETTRDYVLGEGITVHANDEDETQRKRVQEVIDLFWHDFINNLDMKLFHKVLELCLYGEQSYPLTVNPTDGHVTLGYFDPAHIGAVIHDPDNAEIVQAVMLKPLNPADDPKFYQVVGEETDPNEEWYGRLIMNKKGEGIRWQDKFFVFQGACSFTAINKVTNATRGRSDLLSLLDWIDAYDQLLFNEMDRSTLLKNFIWDVSMTGATDKAIDDYKQKNPQPKPGSVRYHSDKIKWEAVSPDLKTTDAQNLSDLFISYMGTGARMPKTWLNGLMDVNRAAAQELGEPAFKHLTARQKIVKYMINTLIKFVLDQAEIAGRLPKRKNRRGSISPVGWNYTVAMPELRPKDLASGATTLVNVVNALTNAIPAQLLDLPIAHEVMAIVLSAIGVDLDIEQLTERLNQLNDQQQQQQPFMQVGGQPSQGGPPRNGAQGGNSIAGQQPQMPTHNGTQYTYND